MRDCCLGRSRSSRHEVGDDPEFPFKIDIVFFAGEGYVFAAGQKLVRHPLIHQGTLIEWIGQTKGPGRQILVNLEHRAVEPLPGSRQWSTGDFRCKCEIPLSDRPALSSSDNASRGPEVAVQSSIAARSDDEIVLAVTARLRSRDTTTSAPSAVSLGKVASFILASVAMLMLDFFMTGSPPGWISQICSRASGRRSGEDPQTRSEDRIHWSSRALRALRCSRRS